MKIKEMTIEQFNIIENERPDWFAHYYPELFSEIQNQEVPEEIKEMLK